MNRREVRKHIFELVFRAPYYTAEEMEEQYRIFRESLREDLPVAGRDATEEEEQAIREKQEQLETDCDEIIEKAGKVLEHVEELDSKLNSSMEDWTTDRIGGVELSILRLALYEILYDENVSTAIAINEAVELAKEYGQDRSSEFVNGVLAVFA